MGQVESTTWGGTANISGLGTTVAGTYQYFSGGTPAPVNPLLTTYNTVFGYGGSALTLGSGGTLSIVELYDTSTGAVAGGYANLLHTHDNTTADISSGSVNYLLTSNTSRISVSGGDIFGGLYTYDNSVLTLFGTGFNETALAPAPIGSPAPQFQVTGTLQDGTPLNILYFDYGGQLAFSAPVSEASTTTSLGLLLALGLGAWR